MDSPYFLLLGVGLLFFVVWLFWANRRNHPPTTIASFDEIKAKVRKGKLRKSAIKKVDQVVPSLSWSDIMDIDDPYDRYLKFGEYVTAKVVKQGYEALTNIERDIYHTWDLETEVNNGGFDQYFFNSAGDHALDTLISLETIGLVETKKLLEQAIAAAFHDHPQSNRQKRWKQLDALTESQKKQLDNLDQKIFALEEPVSELVTKYIDQITTSDPLAE